MYFVRIYRQAWWTGHEKKLLHIYQFSFFHSKFKTCKACTIESIYTVTTVRSLLGSKQDLLLRYQLIKLWEDGPPRSLEGNIRRPIWQGETFFIFLTLLENLDLNNLVF